MVAALGCLALANEAVYVDSQAGNDNNAGTSPAAPVKTIARTVALINSQSDTCVLIKRGSYFREQLIIQSGVGGAVPRVHIMAYDNNQATPGATGPIPVLDCADQIPASAWTPTSGYANVYQCSVTVATDPSGTPVRTALWQDYVNQLEDLSPGTLAATLDPSHCGPNITLSNGDLTATLGTNGDNLALSTSFFSSGSWYWEVTDVTDPNSSLANRIGVAESGVSLTNALGNVADEMGYSPLTGDLWWDGAAQVTGLPTGAAGDVIGIAINATAEEIWVRVIVSGTPGYWNGSSTANPATGTGGVSYSGATIAGANMCPAVSLSNVSAEITANFGSTAFAATPPSGFSALPLPLLTTLSATPGAFVSINNNGAQAGGADTIYVHASDSSNPATSGHVYEFANRLNGVSLFGANSDVNGIETRRPSGANGSLSIEAEYGWYANCIARYGHKHNAIIYPNSTVTNCQFLENYDPYEFGNHLVVFSPTGSLGGFTVQGCLFRNTTQLANDQGPSALICHTGSGVIAGNVLVSDCVIAGIGPQTANSLGRSGGFFSQGVGLQAVTGAVLIQGLLTYGNVIEGVTVYPTGFASYTIQNHQHVSASAYLNQAVQLVNPGVTVTIVNPSYYIQNVQHGAISNSGNDSFNDQNLTIFGGCIYIGDSTTGDASYAHLQLLGTGNTLAMYGTALVPNDSNVNGLINSDSPLTFIGNGNFYGIPPGSSGKNWFTVNNVGYTPAGWQALVAPQDSYSNFNAGATPPTSFLPAMLQPAGPAVFPAVFDYVGAAEALSTIRCDAAPAAEAMVSLRWDASLAAEALGSLRYDAMISAEALESLLYNAALPAESLARAPIMIFPPFQLKGA